MANGVDQSKTISVEEFERVKRRAEDFYKTIGDVHCPYFKEAVHFNVAGLDHVKFKDWRKVRSSKDLFMRLKLLHLAPEVIKLSRTVQGISETKEFVRRKVHSRWDTVLTIITYYEFVAVLENRRVRVVVRHLAGGEKHFWSIQPFWKEDHNGRRKLSYGNPATD